MSFFDDALKSAVPDGNYAKPVMIALGALLAAKWYGGNSNAQPAPTAAPASNPSSGLGGLAGLAGGALAGGLGSGLGGLIDSFQKNGYGDIVNSWIGTGANKPIDTQALSQVLGQGKLADLAKQVGINPQDLLNQLAQALPTAVDRLTPNGQIPSMADISKWGQQH